MCGNGLVGYESSVNSVCEKTRDWVGGSLGPAGDGVFSGSVGRSKAVPARHFGSFFRRFGPAVHIAPLARCRCGFGSARGALQAASAEAASRSFFRAARA